jgi:hypothetical protein
MGASDKRLVRDLVATINRQDGWRCERNNGKWVIYPPDKGPIMAISLTPSDHRWHQNTLAHLRRRGWPPDARLP